MWKTSEETMRRDIFKMKKAEEEGYKVIRIYQIDVFYESDDWLDQTLISEIDSTNREHMFISKRRELYDKHKKLYCEK
jgi:hypothetical protein